MKILIIGGTQFIGKAIANTAHLAGHEIILFNRGGTDPASKYKSIRGDVNNIPSFKDQLKDLAPDVVIHCIAYTEKHA